MHTLEQLKTGQLVGTQRLKLACGLKIFPREIFDLADTLEILDLSGNALSALPDDLPRLRQLRILFCSDNLFTELPEILGQCPRLSMIGFKANQIHTLAGKAFPPSLRWLILTDNRIEALPAEIGQCTALQKLMLAGNRLHTLPQELANCTQLELLRISANQFTELPTWLTTMPRLAWLAYAGNPFCTERETTALNDAASTRIDWDELQLAQHLGEGASGVIHQATHLSQAGERPVAVKLFKGAITSDGLPLSEMTACLHAGPHPNLIPVLGRIQAHPSSAHGLVMALIDPVFRNLANPPSLDSCTRDCYTPDTCFDLNTALQIALGIASAARHLHATGILHGDLYAHNMLHDDRGDILLGDFGAASLLPADNPPLTEALQRIEVRAFACLLEELLERTADEGKQMNIIQTELSRLRAAAMQEDASARPLFAEIEQRLTHLRQTVPAQ